MASIGWALALGVAACSSSSSSGTGGAGGTIVPTAGTSGTLGGATGAAGGTTGAAGGATGSAGKSGGGGTSGGVGGASGVVSCGNLPACVASIVETCPLSPNSCLEFAADSNPTPTTYLATTDFCFAGGVKAQANGMGDLDTGAGTRTVTAIKNGVPCFSLDGNDNSNVAAPLVQAFRDASGTQVATFSTDMSTFPYVVSVTCTTGATAGQTVVVTDFGNCGNPANPESMYCLGGGNCTYP